MYKRLLKPILVIFIALIVAFPVYAFEPNNKFGIHIATPADEDIDDAASLVNSQNGSWGYVALVLQENDLNKSKWQDTFDKLRTHKLIPIIRLATKAEGANWRRPDKHDAIIFAQFLSTLNWPVKEKYVILFNEPNHGSEWGGTCDPVDYADRAIYYARTLKAFDSDFFVMLAGLDQAAPQQPGAYCDEGYFLQTMIGAQPDLFSLIDGLSSHSYPNPGFSASVSKRGRGSIGGYDWELGMLHNLGIQKDLPVYITETGWTPGSLSYETIARYYQSAFSSLWLPDSRVRAVTPFILTYIGAPFQQFSFRSPAGGQSWYPQFGALQSLTKTLGDPPQIEKASVLATLPKTLVGDSLYQFQVWIRNDGQAIWDKRDGYEVKVVNDVPYTVSFSAPFNVAPKRSTVLTMTFQSSQLRGHQDMKVGLFKHGSLVMSLFEYGFDVVDPPSMQLSLKTFPGFDVEGPVEIQIFDRTERLVLKAKKVNFKNGIAQIRKVRGVALNEKYRVVAIKAYYLPRQAFVRFQKGVNGVSFEQLIPGDRNRDGKLGIGDIFNQ